MELLDGKKCAKEIKLDLQKKILDWCRNGGKQPYLVAVLVGDDPASKSYVRSKIKSCEEIGMRSDVIRLPKDVSEGVLLDMIRDLNADAEVDGFIVQLPLPKHIDEERVIMAIDYRKDVDGFHPINLGRMMIGLKSFLPATPMGILTLMDKYNIETSGKNTVILGRSNIVGTPLSVLLSRKRNPGNCTVTLAHSRTKDIESLAKNADILIAAIGQANYVTADMVQDGAVVIDVGINRVDDPNAKRGYRLVGDVDFNAVSQKASYLTPVPGGVGLMTVVSLLQNTFLAAQKAIYD